MKNQLQKKKKFLVVRRGPMGLIMLKLFFSLLDGFFIEAHRKGPSYEPIEPSN